VLRLLACSLAALVAVAPAFGQVRYRLNGSTVNLTPTFDSASPPNGEIDVGDLSTSTVLHIFDSNTNAPSVSVGMITVRGTMLTSTDVLRVAVVAGSVSDPNAIFNNPFEPVIPGLLNCGGFRCLPPTGFPMDTTLRDNTSLHATFLGDITGDVTVGCVWRLHAQRNLTNTAGGTISGNILSTTSD